MSMNELILPNLPYNCDNKLSNLPFLTFFMEIMLIRDQVIVEIEIMMNRNENAQSFIFINILFVSHRKDIDIII